MLPYGTAAVIMWQPGPALLVAYSITNWVIRAGAILFIPHRRPPAQARAWIFFLILLPVPGLIAYWIFGRVYQPRRLALLRARVARLFQRASEEWNDRSQVEDAPVSEHLTSIPKLATSLSKFPMMRGNDLEILDTHPASEDRLVADIDAAVHHVHLMYYIWASDECGRRIASAVERAAARGVKCRVLVDAVGGSKCLKELAPSMRAAGAEVVEMLPVGAWKKKASRFDLRNHRKIAIFDGTHAHIGSANITDPPLRNGEKCQEVVARVRGPVVSQLQVVFLCDHYLEQEDRVADESIFPMIGEQGGTHAHVLPSGPLHDFSHTRKVITSLIHHARHRVCVTTPYFIPDATYINAMQAAALEGVDVHLIVPLRSDSLLVTLAQESFFSELMQAGVKIYCYKPALLHSKMITVDGEIAILGSANMDIRSLDLNREVSLICYDADLVSRLVKLEERYLAHSIQVDRAEWSHRPRSRRLSQNLARLLDSFL